MLIEAAEDRGPMIFAMGMLRAIDHRADQNGDRSRSPTAQDASWRGINEGTRVMSVTDPGQLRRRDLDPILWAIAVLISGALVYLVCT
jgi:hypothetical protein